MIAYTSKKNTLQRFPNAHSSVTPDSYDEDGWIYEQSSLGFPSSLSSKYSYQEEGDPS